MSAQGCKHRINLVAFLLFLNNDLFDELRVNRLHVGVVCEFWVRHDGCRVGVDQRDTQAFFLQHAASLGAGVVELAGLADNNWARTDNQDVVYIVTLWHKFLILFLVPTC